jgi:hypothetical protein
MPHRIGAALVVLVAVLLHVPPAEAASATTYVSNVGNDANTCATPTTACRTFAKAIAETLAGGVVRVLTPGSFGAANITTALSIIADGLDAGIDNVTTGNPASAIFIAAGAADVVTISGLFIDQRGTFNRRGITFVSGRALHLQNCLIRRTSSTLWGLSFRAQNAQLYVSNCKFSEHTDAIRIEPTGPGNTKVFLDRVRLERNTAGLVVSGGSGVDQVTVRDSVIAGNAGIGISVVNNNTGTTNVMVDSTAIVHGATAMRASGTGVLIRVGDSTVTGNVTTRLRQSGGQILFLQNNKIIGNQDDSTSVLTPETR